jgi:hypothetical protein
MTILVWRGSRSTSITELGVVVLLDGPAPKRGKDMCKMQSTSGVDEFSYTREASDLDTKLRELLAPLLGMKPEEITPADVQKFRAEHIYPNMTLDSRSEHGGFLCSELESCLTDREIRELREETDRFVASIGH